MNFTENSSIPLLIHREMSQSRVSGSIDLVLTPQFYTMKKEALPVKYAYQAKRIAHSFFDGLIEDSEKYEYFVYKEENNWIFIAYDPEEILSFLRLKNVPLEKVRKIFFAQQIVSQIHQPIALGEQNALTVINGIATIVPLVVLEESVAFDPSTLVLPKKGIRLDTGSISVISRKYLWMLSGIFLLFGILWSIEGGRYKKDNNTLQTKMQQFYTSYPSLRNKYTRESIAGKYRKIDKEERQKRYIIGKLAGLLFKGVTLNEFKMDQKKFKATLSTSGKAVRQRLEVLLKSAGFTKSSLSSGNTIVIEGRL